jgi:cytochrome c oxidase cbb3-type subunit IV
MFKFIRHYAEQMQDAELYPVIALVIFFLFFTGLLIYVLRMDKTIARIHSSIPLDADEITQTK